SGTRRTRATGPTLRPSDRARPAPQSSASATTIAAVEPVRTVKSQHPAAGTSGIEGKTLPLAGGTVWRNEPAASRRRPAIASARPERLADQRIFVVPPFG